MAGRKSFTVRMKSSPAYTLIIDNFAKVAYWVMTLRVNTVSFTISALRSLKNIIETIQVNSVTFVTGSSFFRELLRIIDTVRVNSMEFTLTVRALYNWVFTTSVNSMTISNYVFRMLYDFENTSAIDVNTMAFSGQPTTGQFPFLSVYDGDLLSTMDTEFLSDLEFIES